MEFTKETINDLADKLLIGLTEEETNMVLDEFTIIDANINKINNIKDIEKVDIMTHALDDFEYVLREDEAEESVNIDDLFKNCDEHNEREIEVPKVVG